MFSRVLEPGKIGTMALKNRLLVPSMVTNFAEEDGSIGDLLHSYYVARAKGGFGLIIVEATAVSPDGRGFVRHPVLYNDAVLPGWQKLADAVHDAGGKIAAQLYHAGRQTYEEITGEKPVSPSPVSSPKHNIIPRELSKKDICNLVKAYGLAALRAKRAGIDGVEVHGGHGYLVSQFISPVFNKRTDEYGGDLLSRLRFALEIIDEIRSQVGKDYPVWIRISAEDQLPGGMGLEEAKVVAALLAGAGYDALSVSAGLTAGGYKKAASTVSPMCVPAGFNLYNCTEIKKSVDVPVIAVGRISDPYLAEQVLKEGRADFVAIGRGSIADPEFPHKTAANRYSEICPCISCMQGCTQRMNEGLPITCMMNPMVGNESKVSPEVCHTSAPKKVVVVGGGPAGLMLSQYLGLRGHEVVLFEKQFKLGGQLLLGAIPPGKQEIARGISYLIRQQDKLGVQLRLATEANIDNILNEKPSAVIICSGGKPLIPPIPGVDSDNVITAHEILAGEKITGQHVAIIGAGLVGCETADFLAERNRDITIIEMTNQVAVDMQAAIRYHLINRLNAYGVTMLLSAEVKKIAGKNIVIHNNGEEQLVGPFDTIVLAAGVKKEDALFEYLKNKIDNLSVVGDSKKPGKALDAVMDAFKVAFSI